MVMKGVTRENEHGRFTLRQYKDSLIYVDVEGELDIYGSTYKPHHFHNFCVNPVERRVGFGLAKFNNNVDQIHLIRIGLELADSLTTEEKLDMRLDFLNSCVESASKEEKRMWKKREKANKDFEDAVAKVNAALKARNDFVKGIDDDDNL